MKKYLVLVLLLLVSPAESFAIFPRKVIAIQLRVDSSARPAIDPAPSPIPSLKPSSQRGHADISNAKSHRSGRSVLSFVMSVAAYLTFGIGLATISFPSAILFLLGSLGFSVAGLVLGISALAHHKKLRGLAIAGVTFSSLLLLWWTLLLVAVSLFAI